MREFFHGWRRKLGVTTLVLAAAVTAAWFRSQFYWDHIGVPFRGVVYSLDSVGNHQSKNCTDSSSNLPMVYPSLRSVKRGQRNREYHGVFPQRLEVVRIQLCLRPRTIQDHGNSCRLLQSFGKQSRCDFLAINSESPDCHTIGFHVNLSVCVGN